LFPFVYVFVCVLSQKREKKRGVCEKRKKTREREGERESKVDVFAVDVTWRGAQERKEKGRWQGQKPRLPLQIMWNVGLGGRRNGGSWVVVLGCCART
jgi:hypothetical protein